MSKIYHGAFVTTDEEEIVIDSNELIQEKLEAYAEKQERKRQAALQKKLDDFLELLDKDDEGNPVLKRDEEGNLLMPADEEGNPLIPVDEDGNIAVPTDEDGVPLIDFDEDGYPVAPQSMQSPDAVGDGAEYDANDPGALLTGNVPERTPEDIIAEAEEEADRIVADAESQAEAIKSHAEAEGEKAGFQEGLNRGTAEVAAEKEALAADRARMESELITRRDEMERELVNVITDVVERVFHARFTDCAEIILHLTENVLSNVTGSKEFLIKVNEANHEYINEHKDELLAKVGSDVTLDIVVDPLLTSEECIVETDGGIFDCGIGVEMENLIKEIRSLAV